MRRTKAEEEKYLKRFEGTVPLVISPPNRFLHKCRPSFVESEIYLEYGTSSIQNIDLNKKYKIIGGLEKAKLEDFKDYDWLWANTELPNLFNRRLVDKMNEICPNDFIALPVTLINLSDKVEPFENKDFYVINALNTLNAIDREKSIIITYGGDMEDIKKRFYKTDPWEGHLIAFDPGIKRMIFHPRLAKALYPSKQFQFLTPEEDSFWRGYPPEREA